jgi:4-alpha-glucanotransferase
MITGRRSGLLLHITSLPSRFGIGDIGPAAHRFIPELADGGQGYWQVLPLHPTLAQHHHSPYHATSVFALNPLFISPEAMVQDGVLDESQLSGLPGVHGSFIEFEKTFPRKMDLLRKAARQNHCGEGDQSFEQFCARNSAWLEDYSIFAALARTRGPDWSQWPEGIRDREPSELDRQHRALRPVTEEEKYLQYLVFSQWSALKARAAKFHVQIIGDLPLYPAYESADVWAHRDLFCLGDNGSPEVVAGVPPDYFSSNGQKWGNPLFRWQEMERQGFAWMLDRFSHLLRLCDRIRVDHFRGLSAYWEIPARASTAREGRWVPAPGESLLSRLAARIPDLPLIAEDLGTITPDVRKLMAAFGIPGMGVLQFGFDGDPENPYAPKAIKRHMVLYTGTHDNNTTRGWFEEDIGPAVKQRLAEALGKRPDPDNVSRLLITLALDSPAMVVIIPVQDLLGLPGNARMNRPATTKGNWRWKLVPDEIKKADWEWLYRATLDSGRSTDRISHGETK